MIKGKLLLLNQLNILHWEININLCEDVNVLTGIDLKRSIPIGINFEYICTILRLCIISSLLIVLKVKKLFNFTEPHFFDWIDLIKCSFSSYYAIEALQINTFISFLKDDHLNDNMEYDNIDNKTIPEVKNTNVGLISSMNMKSSIEVKSGKQIGSSSMAHYRMRVSPWPHRTSCKFQVKI